MKRILKKILAATLSIALLLTAVPLIAGALSEEETLKYLDYEIFGGEVTITGCDSSVSGDITIPSKIEGYPVTVIGPYAFDFCEQLTGIKIPDSVIGIGELAFFSCAKLKSITIPNSVEYIEQAAFLETAYYNNSSNWQSNVLYIGNHLIEVKDLSGAYTIKSGTVTIADKAFFSAKITSVTIPNGVKNIGNSAFDNCSKLKDIVIADSVTQIGIDAFYDTAYYNNSNNWENNVLYIGNHLIYANDDISGEYTIKSGTVTIADKAFAFCGDLTKITIPNSVKSICYLAFYCCSSLTNITIPDSVVYIGAEAFRDCSKLTNITVNPNNKYYSSDSYGVLYNKSKSELIQYPIGNTRTSFTIPSSVTYIYADAFNNCNSLTSIVIPDNVSFIGGAAFANCEGIKSIKIGNGIKTICDGTYYNCNNLTSVTIGSGVTDIGQTAFYGCEALESITIPDNVKSINGYAFAGCTKLKNISLGNGIEKIDSSAFGNTAYHGNSSNWKNHVLYI
ncbi:MAG: leucine-rich repeat domain-containing protein, partial [Acutalibacteraceae bacterium]